MASLLNTVGPPNRVSGFGRHYRYTIGTTPAIHLTGQHRRTAAACDDNSRRAQRSNTFRAIPHDSAGTARRPS